MEEDGFNNDDLLSIGDQLKYRLLKVKEAREELNKESKELDDFVENKFDKPPKVYYIPENSLYILLRPCPLLELYYRMLQTGRHLSTGECVALAKRYRIASEKTVKRYLIKLYSFGFIKKDEYGKYLAVPLSHLFTPDIV